MLNIYVTVDFPNFNTVEYIFYEFDPLQFFSKFHLRQKNSSLVEQVWQTTHDLKVPGLIPKGDIIFDVTIWLMDVG